MTIAEIKTHQVTINNQGLAIDAYLVTPEDAGTYPAVIVIQEIFGVNEHIRDVTERIARQGYVAIAPAMYQRQVPGFAIGYTPEDVKIGREYKNKTTATELLSDIDAAIDYLYKLPQVKTTGVGIVGFCFGGHVTYLGATLERIKAAASFYGSGVANWCPGETEPTIKRTKDIKGTIYCFFGTNDALIPNEQVDLIADELAKQKISHQIFRYPDAEHGFFCDRRGSYNPAAAQDAWPKMLELFSSKL